MALISNKLARLTAKSINLDSVRALSAPLEFTDQELALALSRIRPVSKFDAVIAAYCRDGNAMKRVAKNIDLEISQRFGEKRLAEIGAQVIAQMAVRELVIDRASRKWKDRDRARQMGLTLPRWRNQYATGYAKLLNHLMTQAEDGARQFLKNLGGFDV